MKKNAFLFRLFEDTLRQAVAPTSDGHVKGDNKFVTDLGFIAGGGEKKVYIFCIFYSCVILKVFYG